MKKLNISLAVVAALSIYSSANAQSLAEALTDGKVSGEFTATYEKRSQDKELPVWSGYYKNTSYAVGSFALKYETGTWNDLSLTSKFRAYATLFEDENNDAAERFYEPDEKDLEELFLTYEPNDNFSVKAGRQFISSHWINKTQDALKIDTSFGNTSLEAIWSLRHGRVYSRDYRPLTKMNNNDGIYQIALTHKFSDAFSVTAYDFIAPDLKDIYGAKINAKIGSISLGAHYAANKHDTDSSLDSSLIHLSASTLVAGFSPYIGYVKIDDDASFDHIAGETIIPFEEGDQMYLQGATTYYVGLSKSFGDLSTTLLYGKTDYDVSNDSRTTGSFSKDETTLWLGYPVTKDLKANLGYTITNEDSNDSETTDLNQLNLTLVYSF